MERVDENALAIRILLWLRCFDKERVRWGMVKDETGTHYGVIFELSVDVTESMQEDDDGDYERYAHDEDDDDEHDRNGTLMKLREAIDIVRLLLATQPAMLANAYGLGHRQYDDYEDHYGDDEKSEQEALAALARGVPTELRLRFHFYSVKTRLLEDQLAWNFMLGMGETLSTDEKYLAIRDELVQQIEDDEALTTPVRITLCVDSTEIQEFSAMEAEDFFVGLSKLAEKLYDMDMEHEDDKWTLADHHTPLVVDKIELCLRRFCISYRVVEAAQSFLVAGIPVDCKLLNLDLRLISCSDEDLQLFVTEITHNASRLEIFTGVDLSEEDVEAVDGDGYDRTARIGSILRVIASVEHVHQVNLSGLLTLCCWPVNREAIFRSIVELFASRKQPLNSLSLGKKLVITDRDSQCIKRIANEYRAAHPEAKLHVKRLVLVLKEPIVPTVSGDGQILSRFLSAFDDVQELVLGASRDARPVSADVHAILRFPSLRCVTLRRVCIPSMDLFDPTIADPQLPSKPALQDLQLAGVQFQDIASVARFVTKLKSPTDSVLATSLRVFEIHPLPDIIAADRVFFDHAALLDVDAVLHANRVLSVLSLDVKPDDTAQEDVELLLKHCKRSVLPTPMATRRVDHFKARTMAFLSVIREDSTSSARRKLDTGVVSLILDFSAPYVPRLIFIGKIPWAD